MHTYHDELTQVDYGKPVEVYWNLHKHCWSIRQGGKVMAYRNHIFLSDVTWVVQPAGRAKVLKEKKKNVHAFARGYVFDRALHNKSFDTMDEISYNPYKYDTFVKVYRGHTVTDISPVEHSDVAWLSSVWRFGNWKPYVREIS